MGLSKDDPRMCVGAGEQPARIIYPTSMVGVCPACRRVLSYKIGYMDRHLPPENMAAGTACTMESAYPEEDR